jgi:tetratricopeptide (TPR) repeat protein
MHSNWRDCDAWRNEHLPMTTTSNEACRLYDHTLTQLLAWRDDPQSGGIASTLTTMLAADPHFILGHTLKTGMELLGSNINLNSPQYQITTRSLVQAASKLGNQLTKREQLHVKAVDLLQQGQLPLAADYLEEILIEHPNDIQALKFLSSIYFYTGESRQLHESVARVIPLWKPSMPNYNYLFGMYSFGLAQDNWLDKAEVNARKALDMYGGDAWATHAMCHVNEYRSTFDAGIKFLA